MTWNLHRSEQNKTRNVIDEGDTFIDVTQGFSNRLSASTLCLLNGA
jgi:hypothetical protein